MTFWGNPSGTCRIGGRWLLRYRQKQQIAIASYAFQVFHYYEQILSADPGNGSSQQKAAYKSQMERVRLSVARTKAALAESLADRRA
jgi:hypothetical protein